MKSVFTFVVALLTALSGVSRAADQGKPNIIFVLADDLGIDGVSCYGADKHQTPPAFASRPPTRPPCAGRRAAY
jgi:hypothetical protein